MGEAKPMLLPCPFCGGAPSHGKTMDEDIWSHNTVPWMRVRCSECEIGTDYVCEGYEPSEVEAWNRRSGQLVERVKELEAVVRALIAYDESDHEDGVQMMLDYADMLKGAYAALSKARPNTAEGDAEAEATDGMRWNQTPCEHCGHTEGEHFNARCLHITGETRYTPAAAKEPSP